MDSSSLLWTLPCSCDEALQRIKHALLRHGLRVLETFDLQDARLGLADCACPHHGTDACDCQMIVLMIYGEEIAPATLILHGSDGRTWLSLADGPLRHSAERLGQMIEQAVGGIFD